MVNVVPREVLRPWDLPRHNIHHDTSSAFSNNVPLIHYQESVLKHFIAHRKHSPSPKHLVNTFGSTFPLH